MKIFLMVVTLGLSVSVFAADACKVGSVCSKEDCAKLGASEYGLNAENKCVKIGSSQTQTDCADIVSSSGAKAPASTTTAGGGATDASGKTK